VSLADLAAAHGVATSYADFAGTTKQVSESAVIAALKALDVDATTAADIERSLRLVEQARWAPGLPECVVTRQGGHVEVVAQVPPVLHVRTEDGVRVNVEASPVALESRDELTRWQVALPYLPLGYHRVVHGQDETALIVVPERAPTPVQRHWGWQLQLYALRSAGSWGIGDYADLRTIAEAAARDGAGVVLVNPLHAELPTLPVQNSPYSPSSRLFRSALALRLEDAPEWSPELERLKPAVQADRIDRDATWRAKLAALEQMWPRHRVGALATFREERGAPLEQYAIFCALAERHGLPWQDWPEGLVVDRDRVAFWCWVQLLVDEQLAGVGEGLGIGVVHDLAVGVNAGGADAWALQSALALGSSVGAPPDLFNQRGQDWGLPPWRPDRLRAQAYAPFRDMVRGVLRHAGGIRVDHVMGLSRLWWIPAGSAPDEGTYVSYDAGALMGILALEATRAGAVIIGEDLGTVDDSFRELLDETGVLGSDVLWFQTNRDGSYLAPPDWRRDAAASVTTHDLPTASGWLVDEHVRVRAELGQLGHSREQEQARVDQDREQLLAMLQDQGLLEDDVPLALHRALVASPCTIVLASLGDGVGDLRQPNLPGTVDEYPNWRLPVADASGRPLGLEEVLDHPGVRRLTAVLQQVTPNGSLPCAPVAVPAAET
jgi:4-alpha-glucanotransferase